jgi:predicted aldo/keto reductase-like oxidoreductase
MKALSGGLITDIFAAQAWMAQFANVVPIWGIQRESELDKLFQAMKQTGGITPGQQAKIIKDRSELGGEFCRGCGYCLPCPAEIPINIAARIPLLMTRAPVARFLTEDFQKTMNKIENCQRCGHCTSNCPYNLDTPALLEKNLHWYRDFIAQKR